MFFVKIIQDDVKIFMNMLLKQQTFDTFEVRSVDILSIAKFSINGIYDKAFSASNEVEEQDENVPVRKYCLWAEMKPYVFALIKGEKRPKQIKITLSLPTPLVYSLHKNAAAFFLNITYDGEEILLSATTSERNFIMDKTIDIVWEDYITNFIKNNKISVSTQL